MSAASRLNHGRRTGNQINPNLVRRWIRLQQRSATASVESDAARIDSAPAQSAHQIALVPLLVSDPVAFPSQADESGKTYPVTQRALGVKEFVPYFEIRQLCEQHGVAVFSSNYALYGDMSSRMMGVIGLWGIDQEVYSID